MGLMPIKKNGEGKSADTPAAAAAPAVAAAVEQPTVAAAAPAPAAAVAVVSPNAGAVSTKVARPVRNAIEEKFKDKMQLEWNTMGRVQANQGNFLDLERNGAAFGNVMVVQLLSYQASWQISPGTDNPDDNKLVRYSNDGITTTDGQNCLEYLKALKDADYDKAKINPRYLLAFGIEATPGDPSGVMVDKIAQIDLSATSKASFDQFMAETGWKESKGSITPEVAERGLIRMTAQVKTANKFSWTIVRFELAV